MMAEGNLLPMQPEYCERCRRPAPAWESDEYVEWEAIELPDGEVGVICPGCITGGEQREILEDAMQDIGQLASFRDKEPGLGHGPPDAP
jgi:hypothetical protein